MKLLRDLRQQHGLTQQIVAKAIGVDRTTYAKYESGLSEPNHEITIKLADFYSVSIDDLMGYNSKKEPTAPEDGEPMHTITFNRNGKVVKKQYSAEKWEAIIKMLDAIPEDRLP